MFLFKIHVVAIEKKSIRFAVKFWILLDFQNLQVLIFKMAITIGLLDIWFWTFEFSIYNFLT